MKCVTYLDRSLLVDDETADTLLRYATLLTARRQPDSVQVNALNFDGQEVLVAFLLGDAAPLMVESNELKLPEPENGDAITYMHERMARLLSPNPGLPDEYKSPAFFDDFEV